MGLIMHRSQPLPAFRGIGESERQYTSRARRPALRGVEGCSSHGVLEQSTRNIPREKARQRRRGLRVNRFKRVPGQIPLINCNVQMTSNFCGRGHSNEQILQKFFIRTTYEPFRYVAHQ